MGYQPFMVAPFNTAISTYLKPWMQPEDAFIDMEDCYTYRGVVTKRLGFSLFDSFPNAVNTFFIGTGDGVTTSFTVTIPYVPIARLSMTITHTYSGGTVSDGHDTASGYPISTITGTNLGLSAVNYLTGVVVLNFTAAPTINTPIKLTFGVLVAVGNGGTTYACSLPITGAFAAPIKPKSVFIGNVSTGQGSNPSFDVPTTIDTGSLVGGDVSAGVVQYSTGKIDTASPPSVSVTFNAPITLNTDIFAQWEFQAPSNPIKGIPFFWTATSSQDTLVFNNNQVAKVDPLNFKLTNISGGDIFNTSQKAFFFTANYLGRIFILNNNDPLTVWDGTNFTQPVVAFSSLAPTTNNLDTGLLIFLYKNRLVILRPTENGVIQPQRARYCKLNDPFTWFSDFNGAGGFIDAPTPEWIVAAEFLRDELIVHFQESTWRLRYTANDIAPYRWEKINESRRVDAPYACTKYQNFETSVGTTGLLRCDSVNIERYDDKIIDFTEDEIDQANIDICNSYRFDNLNQQWICYPVPDVDINFFSQKWLVWNFLENSFSKYNIGATCFGAYFQGRDLTWADFNCVPNGFCVPGTKDEDIEWKDFASQNWLSYFSQANAKLPIFGTYDGKVNKILPAVTTDDGTRIGFFFTTKDFNPFVKQGQRCVLGYVDFYFDRPDNFPDVDPNYLLSIDFYVDEIPDPILTVVLNPSEDDWQHKRVFVNVNAQFHRFRVYLSDDQIANSSVVDFGFTLNGWIWWAQPGGRIVG